MFNQQSPIVNNMMMNGQNNGIYPNGYIPPNPISNVVPIGNTGYNTMNNNMGNMNGYYNNNNVYNNMYNNYYNPYLAAQQEQMRQAQLMEQQRAQSDMFKSISRKVNKSLGREVDDEYLKRYDPEDPRQVKQDEELIITNRLLNLHYNGYYGNYEAQRFIEANNRHFEQIKQQYPDDMSMLEFSEKFADIYVEHLQDKEKESRKNLTQLYDRNGYNQLIQMHKNSNNYFSTVFQGGNPNREVTIDDMEVKLPNHMQNEYQARRQAFLSAILNK